MVASFDNGNLQPFHMWYMYHGRCLTESIVYRAEVRQAGNGNIIVKMCAELTEGTCKQRYDNHLTTFRHQKYENSTGLSKYRLLIFGSDICEG